MSEISCASASESLHLSFQLHFYTIIYINTILTRGFPFLLGQASKLFKGSWWHMYQAKPGHLKLQWLGNDILGTHIARVCSVCSMHVCTCGFLCMYVCSVHVCVTYGGLCPIKSITASPNGLKGFLIINNYNPQSDILGYAIKITGWVSHIRQCWSLNHLKSCLAATISFINVICRPSYF